MDSFLLCMMLIKFSFCSETKFINYSQDGRRAIQMIWTASLSIQLGEIKFPNGKQTRRMYVTALVRPMCVKPRDVGSQVTITTAHPLHRVIKLWDFRDYLNTLRMNINSSCNGGGSVLCTFLQIPIVVPFQTTVKIWEMHSCYPSLWLIKKKHQVVFD